jgi:acetoin utilization deacetylase AcuC-like enzyme
VTTGFFLHPAAALHDPGWGHPEHQGRLRALASAVGKDLLTLHGRVEQMEPRAATMQELLRVHSEDHLEHLFHVCRRAEAEGRSLEVGPETLVSAGSREAILGSSGAVLEAVERVADGTLANAFVAARPPGHHATRERAMGFCPVNHVAVGARHLQATGRARRVAIVDWDVHHGNGTQEVFWQDPDVFYLSFHQWPAFPGSGTEAEVGRGEGRGTTRNVLLPPGTDGPAYLATFRRVLAETEAAFHPEFILVSAGYDGLAQDPMGGLMLEPADYAALTREVMAWADRACGGRVVAVLEGGFDPGATGRAVVATLRSLAGVEESVRGP